MTNFESDPGLIVTPVNVLPSVNPGIVVVEGAPELVDGGMTGGTVLVATILNVCVGLRLLNTYVGPFSVPMAVFVVVSVSVTVASVAVAPVVESLTVIVRVSGA